MLAGNIVIPPTARKKRGIIRKAQRLHIGIAAKAKNPQAVAKLPTSTIIG